MIDAVAWATDRLVPSLEMPPAKLGSVGQFTPPARAATSVSTAGSRALAAALAEEVFVPPSAGCCGFAGDRGFLHPELTEAATREQAAEVASGDFDAYLSSNRTCEMGMERATGRPYVHAVQALEELTRAG